MPFISDGVLISMVTRMFNGYCPITGCDYHIRVEGKDASVKNIMNHVTEFHKLSDNVMDQDYNVPCPLKASCHEIFTGRRWLDVSTELLSHLRNAHSNFIDPDLCKVCADRNMKAVLKELHPERYPKDDSDDKTPEKKTESEIDKKYPGDLLMKMHVDEMTDEQYCKVIMWYNGHLPPGPEGQKLIKARKVYTGFDYLSGQPWPEIEWAV